MSENPTEIETTTSPEGGIETAPTDTTSAEPTATSVPEYSTALI